MSVAAHAFRLAFIFFFVCDGQQQHSVDNIKISDSLTGHCVFIQTHVVPGNCVFRNISHPTSGNSLQTVKDEK